MKELKTSVSSGAENRERKNISSFKKAIEDNFSYDDQSSLLFSMNYRIVTLEDDIERYKKVLSDCSERSSEYDDFLYLLNCCEQELKVLERFHSLLLDM